MTPGETLLRYASARVGYAGKPVVTSADLTVAAGEIVGLVGPNGAGKSTLLRVVTGDAELQGGAVEVVGRSLSDITPQQRAALVGVVPQQVTAAFSFPAAEFVEMGRHPHLPRFGRPGPADRHAVESRLQALAGTLHERRMERTADHQLLHQLGPSRAGNLHGPVNAGD